MLLPITLTLAAAMGLLTLWLAMRVSRARMASKVVIGDGGDPQLITRMRAQSNFVEYTPFVLILMGLVELARGPVTWLWVVAIVYVLARIAHPFGMERPAPNALRAGGILLTFLTLIVLSAYALFIVYTAPHA
jgi:uncharacterized membrane protein YecN with MAPEG domain